MPPWQVNLDLRPADAEQPVFLRLARAITDDVRRGRLKPGAALPGSRTLARALGVHRNTVLAAYAELEAEGWLTTEPAAGTFISRALPEVERRRGGGRAELPPRPGFDLNTRSNFGTHVQNDDKKARRLSAGTPDLRLIPSDALARAYRRALRLHGPELLGYGDARGHRRLRRALGDMLSALRGVAADEDGLMITRGSQLALDLVARALLAPGDVVAVEGLGYRPAWTALASTGARLVPLPVDAHGLDVAALAALAERQPLRALYVTPHHQFPTTVTLAPGRRLQLLELARAKRIAVIEDDYDFDFHYEGRPVLPMAAADRAGVVVYVGTLSKILAPALRLGFVVAPVPLIDRLAELRLAVDRQGDQIVECAVAELIEDGELGRHARRMRRVYQARRDALAASLRRRLGGALAFDLPAGGMALWVRADGIDVDAWAARALDGGVRFYPGRFYAFDGQARAALRLTFAAHDEAELDDGVRRLAASLRG